MTQPAETAALEEPGLVQAPAPLSVPPSRLPRGLSAFRHRNFRVFWTGQLVSLVGTWMATVARSWLVLEMTNDPFALGIVAAAQFTPVLLLGLIGGVVADAAPKRRALIVLQTIMCLNAALLAALVLTNGVTFWSVVLLTAVLGTANAIEMPTRQAFVIEMVGREDIANAVALNSAAFNTSRIVGPAAAGLLIAFVSLPAALVIDALSYLAAIYALLRIDPSHLRATARGVVSRTPRAIAGQLAEGLRYVRDTPAVLLPIVVLGLVSTAGMNFQVLIPVMARDVLGAGPDGYGFLLAASALGSLSAALAIAFGMRPTQRLLLGGALAFGVLESLFALSRTLPTSLALMFGMGFGVIAIAATANTTIQLTAPDRLRGRVMSVYVTVFAGSTPIGGLIAGTIAARAGAPAALLFGGVVSAVVGVAAIAASRQAPRHAGPSIADRRV
jgi:MFS family permease